MANDKIESFFVDNIQKNYYFASIIINDILLEPYFQ
jgi:hypothetical protein